MPEWIRAELEVWQANLRLLEVQIVQHKKELAQSSKEALPKGFGAESMVQLDREIGDYHRFANRRKVGCFGGFVIASLIKHRTFLATYLDGLLERNH